MVKFQQISHILLFPLLTSFIGDCELIQHFIHYSDFIIKFEQVIEYWLNTKKLKLLKVTQKVVKKWRFWLTFSGSYNHN